MLVLGCKAVGLAALTFCIGIVAGLILPIQIVAVLEAILLVVIGYCCLFKWWNGGVNMKIVVMKAPKALRGVLKAIFKM